MISWKKAEEYTELARQWEGNPARVSDLRAIARPLRRWLKEHQPIIDEHGVNDDTFEIHQSCEKVRKALAACGEPGSTFRKSTGNQGHASSRGNADA